ncbi:alkaline phosphatase [Paenibacillus sp. HJL G12]|uniref:Alkaline phosphatase n=1 Tax=Paenibacillus dendrobii TaxID=2691084 RepID=A0A7X3IRB2_9BACL|nr:alkaline phosphatase [Paenibacillus dendrobii]MWV46817.1 alkaline phosphatase [Paenibacillus dendrobii]
MHTKRSWAYSTFAAAILTGSLMGSTVSHAESGTEDQKVKNVIMVIPDGMGNSITGLTRWYQNGKPLEVDSYVNGLVRTYASNSITTDSGAAATAYATGHKAVTESLSILPREVTMPGVAATKESEMDKPVSTILEAARLAGKSTGLVFTCTLDDATPDAFVSHAISRNESENITKQMAYSGVDVLFGGGSALMKPEGKDGGARTDGVDLTKALQAQGYEYVTNKAGMDQSKAKKIWGLFQPWNLDADFDRNPKEQPSLAEMTTKSLSILSSNPNGFFLMVEASDIDTFGHENDPAGMISETLAYDKAMKVAIDFAKKDGHTAVISMADHNTGGLYLTNYDSAQQFNAVMQKAKLTNHAIQDKINKNGSNIKQVLEQYYGLTGLTTQEIAEIKRAWKQEDGDFSGVIGRKLGERAGISFANEDHTSEDVVLYAYHPHNFRPTDYAKSGVLQNTDINHYVQYIMEFNLEDLNKNMYASGHDIRALGATVKFDNSNQAFPVAVVEKGGKQIRLAVDKNFAVVNGQKKMLKVTTLLIGDRLWTDRSVLELLK